MDSATAPIPRPWFLEGLGHGPWPSEKSDRGPLLRTGRQKQAFVHSTMIDYCGYITRMLFDPSTVNEEGDSREETSR